ncbi:armadillo-type protein [Phycomyces blakesleeanus]
MIAEFTAAIVAKCCDTPEQQMELASAGVLKPLINLLYSNCIKAQEAALDALATLCRENTEIGKMVVGGSLTQDKQQSCIETILEFVKEKCPKMRLIAATCLTNLYRTGAFSESTDSIVLVVLPALVKLLSEPTGDVQEKAPLVLADLIKDSEDMQKAAFEAYAIPRLVELLATLSTKDSNSADLMLGVPGVGSLAKRKQKIRENCLIAIAAATLAKEECRTQAIDQKVLPYVVQALQSEYPNVRLAACQCAKSLSRSVSNLRTSLVDAGIAVPLIKLLNDSSIVIQAAACGAICNLVLEFSPMRKSVIDGGGIEHFVEFSRSSDPKLQLNGVWALKSLLFKSDLPVKKAVMKVLTYNALIDLLHQPAPAIQEQALEIVRNLVCGNQEAIEDVIEGIGKDDLLDVIESKLEDTFDMDVDDEDDAAVARVSKECIKIETSRFY